MTEFSQLGRTLSGGFLAANVFAQTQKSHKSFNYGELYPQPRQLYSQCVLGVPRVHTLDTLAATMSLHCPIQE